MTGILSRIETALGCRKASVTLEASISLAMLMLVCFSMIMASRVQYMGECLDQALFAAGQSLQFSVDVPRSEGESMVMEKGLDIISEARVKNEFDRALAVKGIDDSAYKLKLERISRGSFRITASVEVTLPLIGSLKSFKNIHIIRPDFYGNSYADQYVVSVYGERYHLPECHTIRGHEGIMTLSVDEAKKDGKTPCSICIGKMLFGKPYNPEL